jgi:hypothetical protein
MSMPIHSGDKKFAAGDFISVYRTERCGFSLLPLGPRLIDNPLNQAKLIPLALHLLEPSSSSSGYHHNASQDESKPNYLL